MHKTLIIVAAALLSVPALAQNSLRVGPGGYASVNDALAVAQPGDEIVVAPGTYAGFSLNKGVTVRAELPGSVTLEGTPFSFWILPAGERARLVGLSMPNVRAFGGSLAFEDCLFNGVGTIVSLTNTNVHFERCTMAPIQSALLLGGLWSIDGSVVSMVDCNLQGTYPAVLTVAYPTLELRNGSHLVASGLTITGGLPANPAPALAVDASSTARITDSTLTAGGSVCPIVGTDVVCERCTVSPGCGVLAGEPLLGVSSSGPIIAGLQYTLTFRGEANQPLLVFGSDDLGMTVSPLLRQPFLLSEAGCFPAAMLVTDANGRAAVTWQLASLSLPPAIGLWFQGVAGSSFPLAASAAVGGVAR